MGGANLEVFKFGFYMFFPILVMFKFGDPEWYESNVKPYKELLFPAYESTYRPPRTSEELHSELARLKAERLARRAKDRPLEGPGPDTQGAGSGVQVELARPGRPNWDGTQ